MAITTKVQELTEAEMTEVISKCELLSKHELLIKLFIRAHANLSPIKAIYQFLCGEGPAAVAAGRSGYRDPMLDA